MKKQELTVRREEKLRQKQEKQKKVMTVLGIVAAVLVAGLAVAWSVYNVYVAQTRALTNAEKLELFEEKERLPEKDDPIVGTWYLFTADGQNIHSKYVFGADGKLEVFQADPSSKDGEYRLVSHTEYRLRPKTGELFVMAEDANMEKTDNVVTYEYTVTEEDNAYTLTWKHEKGTWVMLRTK